LRVRKHEREKNIGGIIRSFNPAKITRGGKIMKKAFGIRLPFIANEGQINEDTSFYARTFGGTVFITRKGEIVYSLPRIAVS